jgi:hypothetical protein
MPRLKQLLAGLSSRRPGCDPELTSCEIDFGKCMTSTGFPSSISVLLCHCESNGVPHSFVHLPPTIYDTVS